MKHIKTEETKTCDCCGKLIEYNEYPSLEHSLIMNITILAWNAKLIHVSDVCDDCNQRIMKFLEENGLLKFAQHD